MSQHPPTTQDPEPPRGPKRRLSLSANMPRVWLHRRELWDLDDVAWRLYWSAIQWAVGETDGVIPHGYLSLLHPDYPTALEAAGRLVDVGLWALIPEGYLIVDWPQCNNHPDTIAHARWVSRQTSRTSRRDKRGDTSRKQSRIERQVLSTHLESELAGTSPVDLNGHGALRRATS